MLFMAVSFVRGGLSARTKVTTRGLAFEVDIRPLVDERRAATRLETEPP